MATAGAAAGRHVVLEVDVAASPGRTMAGRQQSQFRSVAAATLSRTRHRPTALVLMMAAAAPPPAFVYGMPFAESKTGRPLSSGCECTWALPVQSQVVLPRCRPRRAFGLSATTAADCGVPPRILSGMRWCARPPRRLVKTRRARARGEARLVDGSRLEMRTVRGGRVDVEKGRGRGQPAPVDSLLWPAHVSVAGLVLLTMSFADIPGCLSLFLLCSGSFLLFVRRVLFHGWRSRVRPHVSAASCAAAGAPARAPAARARTLAAGASSPLFEVVFLGLLLLARARASAAYGRLHVLVLGHRLGVLLCLCLGWFFGAVAVVLVLVHPLLYGRLHVLVLGHRRPVFLRSIKVRICGWCFRARAAVPTASEAAAGALTRASCVVPCAAVFPYSHPFLLAVLHLAMSRRTTGMRYLLFFSSQADFLMT